MLKLDSTCTWRKWSGQETVRCRSSRTRLECYGDGCGTLDAKSEDGGPRMSTGHCSHKVKEGDTLTSIANKYKVTVQSIAYSNGIADIDYIHAGKLLLIPVEHCEPYEVHPNANDASRLGEIYSSESQRVVVHTESSLLMLPKFASSMSSQSWHMKLALFLVLLSSLSSFLKRCISDLRTRRDKEVLRYEIEKEAQDVHHQPKLKRWQGILDDDRKIDEVNGDTFADGRTILELEEEKLRQSYAQLESKYVKFLADSGLTKSGYWCGSTPSASEGK